MVLEIWDGILGHQIKVDFKEKPLVSGFKDPYKKAAKQENLTYTIHEKRFVERKCEYRKPDKNSSLRWLEIMPRKLD
jgi:hypothetical protein